MHPAPRFLAVFIFGDTIAVTGWLVVKGRGPDGRLKRFAGMWMKPNGSWQLVAAQEYLRPEGE
jgi:hypothetical protein